MDICQQSIVYYKAFNNHETDHLPESLPFQLTLLLNGLIYLSSWIIICITPTMFKIIENKQLIEWIAGKHRHL